MQAAPVLAQVRDVGDAFRASLTSAFAVLMSAIPRILGFLLVLVAGWFISSLIARGVQALLRAIRFNELAQRAGIEDFVRNMGVRTDSAGVIADVAKWFVRLIALVVAFDALGLPAVSDVLRQLLLWLPNLVVALVVLVVGGIAARALGNLVRGATAEAGFRNPDLFAAVARIAVLGFTIVVAVNQLGIATVLINTLLIGVVAAFAIATGLAFGLGGRDKAAQLLDSVSLEAQGAAPKLERAARAARSEAREEVGAVAGTGPRTREMWVDRRPIDRRRSNGVA
jgi:hypothetical protein